MSKQKYLKTKKGPSQEEDVSELRQYGIPQIPDPFKEKITSSLKSIEDEEQDRETSIDDPNQDVYSNIDDVDLTLFTTHVERTNFQTDTDRRTASSTKRTEGAKREDKIPLIDPKGSTENMANSYGQSIKPDYDDDDNDVVGAGGGGRGGKISFGASIKPDYDDDGDEKKTASKSTNERSRTNLPPFAVKLPIAHQVPSSRQTHAPTPIKKSSETTPKRFAAQSQFQDPENVSDLCDLPQLTLDDITDYLHKRYSKDLIYTYCKEILISVNPYRELDICSPKKHDDYRPHGTYRDPHLFAVSARAFTAIKDLMQNQVILVSGESGAGKTEATKMMVQHLMTLGGSDYSDLEKRIVDVNPLLEAFGNATTKLNDNSSRFAKFLRLYFRKDGKVAKARVNEYMLEKSRVVSHGRDEKTFHSFYALLLGAPAQTLETTYLNATKRFSVTGDLGSLKKEQRDQYKKIYQNQQRVLKDIVELDDSEIQDIHFIMGAILHLGEIQFEPTDDDCVVIQDETALQKAANLLCVGQEDLARILIERRGAVSQGSTHGHHFKMSKSMKQAEHERNGLAKTLYEKLFGWLVKKINDCLKCEDGGNQLPTIGILDICGFENLSTNSFEQLCINLINEQLQNFMNKKIIEDEKELYRQENIDLDDVDTSRINNDHILEMFLGKAGILDQLDEHTKIAFKQKDSLFVQELNKVCKGNDNFRQSRANTPEFTIVHFAGEVPYNANFFIVKNGDMLSEDMVECMKNSKSNIVADLFKAEINDTGSISTSQFQFRGSRRPRDFLSKPLKHTEFSRSINKSRRKKFGNRRDDSLRQTVPQQTHVQYFKNSLNELERQMRLATPYYVRCIKPNIRQKPALFDPNFVRKQLSYNGVTEVARIRQCGYPVRVPKNDFETKYGDLVEMKKQNQELCNQILDTVKNTVSGSDFRVGKYQIFMKTPVQERLNDVLADLRRRQEEEKRKKEEEDKRRKKEEEEKRKKEEEDKRRKKEEEEWKNRTVEQREIPLGPIEELPTPAPSTYDPPYNRSIPSTSSSSDTDDTTTGPEDKPPVPEDQKKDYPWNVSGEFEEEEHRRDVDEQPVLMVVKVIVYGLFFMFITGALVCHKVSLFLLLSELKPELEDNPQKRRDRQTIAYIFLLIALCIPYAVGWIVGSLKLCFGKFDNPSFWTWVWVFLMDSCHAGGLCLLVFRVLPEIHVIRGAMLLCGTALLPAFLKVVLGGDQPGSRMCLGCKGGCSHMSSKAMRILMDWAAFLIQLSVIPLIIFMDYIPEDIEDENSKSIKSDHWRILELVGGVLLSSFGHWENFSDGNFFFALHDNHWFKDIVLKIRYQLQEGRHYPGLIVSPWKIALTVILAYLLRDDISLDFNDAIDKLEQAGLEIKSISSVITVTVAAFVAFYVACGACKFQMQIVSMNIPLMLATPITIGVFYLDCHFEFMWHVTDSITGHCPSELVDERWYHFVFGCCWLLSLILVTRYLWTPAIDRAATIDRLFINPYYCGILTTEGIMLNRRRRNDPVVRTADMDLEHFEQRQRKYHYSVGFDIKKNDDLGQNSNQADVETGAPEGLNEVNSDVKLDHPCIPTIYSCATMWHETTTEMLQILKSLHRLDLDQALRYCTRKSDYDPDLYNFEGHIFFDDAMELDDNDERIVNDFVKMLVKQVEIACSSVHGKPMKVHDPIKIPTPYGGQLVWQMPGGNLLYVHLKDVGKIRNRKRWSQVMYMFYLLNYRMMKECQVEALQQLQDLNEKRGHQGLDVNERMLILGMEADLKSRNTFLLALDGDTDFTPGSVKILLDRMKDPKVAASCGRIHPIGNGPMIWYQKFEYAIGHWLQKAAEHVFGCVLCSPGCFSLFRASALMESNVMKTYTREPTEARHHLQYDQGEDRWLCTLLLQQGFRIEYAAAADAWTFAPEGFFEFFIQRRRWMPSTIANILDLLASASITTERNPNISYIYIMYQWLMMIMTILGPGTILMMIAGAVTLVFNWDLIDSYLFATIPAAVYTVACFRLKTRHQLIFAAALSVVYTFIMMIVLVGTIITSTTENLLHPSVIVIVLLVFIFSLSGICHPQEISCLVHGIMYMLTIPSGYLLLVIFSICNLNDVSWGTREVKSRRQRQEEEEKKRQEAEEKKNAPKQGFWARLFSRGEVQIREITGLIKTLIPDSTDKKKDLPADDNVVQLLSKIEGHLAVMSGQEPLNLAKTDGAKPVSVEIETKKASVKGEKGKEDVRKEATTPEQKEEEEAEKPPKKRDELKNPFWSEDPALGGGRIVLMNEEECDFWRNFVRLYLKPIRPTKEDKDKIAEELRDLRNNSAFAMIIINLLWMALNFMFQYSEAAVISFNYTYGGRNYEFEESVLGLSFVILLLTLLFIQLIGMLIHRAGTLQHLLAFTKIKLGRNAEDYAEFGDKNNLLRHARDLNSVVVGDDEGCRTDPPELAPEKNQWGVTMAKNKVIRSVRGEADEFSGTSQREDLSKSFRNLGPVFDAERVNDEGIDASRAANFREEMLTGRHPNLGISVRPQLPPRDNDKRRSRYLPKGQQSLGMTLANKWADFPEMLVPPAPAQRVPSRSRHKSAVQRGLDQRLRRANQYLQQEKTISSPRANQNSVSVRFDLNDIPADLRAPSGRRNHFVD